MEASYPQRPLLIRRPCMSRPAEHCLRQLRMFVCWFGHHRAVSLTPLLEVENDEDQVTPATKIAMPAAFIGRPLPVLLPGPCEGCADQRVSPVAGVGGLASPIVSARAYVPFSYDRQPAPHRACSARCLPMPPRLDRADHVGYKVPASSRQIRTFARHRKRSCSASGAE